jgi:hypothetical protein
METSSPQEQVVVRWALAQRHLLIKESVELVAQVFMEARPEHLTTSAREVRLRAVKERDQPLTEQLQLQLTRAPIPAPVAVAVAVAVELAASATGQQAMQVAGVALV